MCQKPGQSRHGSAAFVAATQLSELIHMKTGTLIPADKLISLLKQDWDLVARNAHLIHEGERHSSTRDRRTLDIRPGVF